MDKYIGKILDNRYEITELIGSGGMANVYRAHCKLLKRDVAIKILKDEFMKDSDFRKRFRNESLAVAKLSHNNIVSVYDVSKTDEIDYIVMELIDGITLKEYLGKKGYLNFKETLFLTEQIIRALNHAHNRNIIHQDIKPHNIILLRDGTIKVADFGIAKILGNNETQVINQTMGSVHYISPEAARGGTINKTSDIYSLGVVMYEMLTGRLPFDGDNVVSIVMKHINETPDNITDFNPDIPQSMNNIVLKCMNPVISKRYETVQGLYKDLEILKENPVANIAYQKTDNLSNTCDIKFKNPRVNDIKPNNIKSNTNLNRKKSAPKKNNIPEFISIKSIAVTISILVVIAGIFSISVFFGGGNNRDKGIDVPKLLGENIEELDLETLYPDFIFNIDTKVAKSEIPGTIIDQNPKVGEKIEKGGSIDITAAILSDEENIMPDFKNMEYRTALAEILQLEVGYNIEREYSEEIELDKVIKTSPEAGDILNTGDKITLVVSEGAPVKLVKVPNLVGITEERAKDDLKTLGLEVGYITKQPSSKNSGIVLSQSVAKDIEVALGTKIDITVSEEEKIVPENPAKPVEPEIPPQTEVQGSVTLQVALPSDERKSARVTIKNNKTILYDKTHNTDEKNATITLKGSGSALLSIEIDGSAWAEQAVTFK